MRGETRCIHCGASIRVTVRPGPSGSFRLGGLSVRCPGCARVLVVRVRPPRAAAEAVTPPA